MSKDKTDSPHTGNESTPGEAQPQAEDDPLTSFNPKAPPAERSVGNGSDRTVHAAGEEATPIEGSGETREGEPEAPPEEAESLEAQLDQARQDSVAHYDRFLRLQAEFENYKKRIHKEHQDSLRFAVTPLVTEMATVLDNLERAVEHARKEPENGAAGLLEGIEMVLRQLQETLGRFGVTRIEAVGKEFDPALHEAMTVVETNEVPDNHVFQEFQAGYLLHDRVIRPARVSVAKRAPDAGPDPAAAAN